MLKVAVIGDRESVCGFKTVGFDVFIPGEEESCDKLLKRICEKEAYAVIYITEQFGGVCEAVIKKYEDKISPAIILIPGVSNNTGEGMNLVNQYVERAVGSQLSE